MTERRGGEVPRYDVVIVGAGPVGLTLASLLRDRGLAIVVLERHATAVTHGRAMHLDRASVELLRRAGVRWREGVDLDPLAGVTFRGADDAEFRIALGALCPDAIAPFAFFQPAVERALTAQLERSTVELRFGAEVRGLVLQGEAVRVDVFDAATGRTEPVRAPLVVGCDGAHSLVRSAAQLPLRRWLGGAWWRATDYRLRHPLPERLVRHRLATSASPTTVVPGCGSFARFETRVPTGRTPGGGDTLAAEQAFGVPIEETIASREYRYDTCIAWSTHRTVGRCSVVIMGDAAHTVPPFLGQGLGLGLRDAAQLAALLRPPTADLAGVVARYSRARRRDVIATAVPSMLAQLLVEHGGSWAPHRLDRLLRAMTRLGSAAPGVVHRLAVAHRADLGDQEVDAEVGELTAGWRDR